MGAVDELNNLLNSNAEFLSSGAIKHGEANYSLNLALGEIDWEQKVLKTFELTEKYEKDIGYIISISVDGVYSRKGVNFFSVIKENETKMFHALVANYRGRNKKKLTIYLMAGLKEVQDIVTFIRLYAGLDKKTMKMAAEKYAFEHTGEGV